MFNLRNIPAVDEILLREKASSLIKTYNRDFVIKKVRQILDEVREEVRLEKEPLTKEYLMEKIESRLQIKLESESAGTLYHVINGTGVVLHTNLGRAPLGARAINYMNEISRGYSNLEIDMEKGERGSRYGHVEKLLQELTGAEAALVVNNNAAAVLLGLNTLANNKEVIVSRGQLVEIGGAFRIPEVMKQSGALLVEVGTTNKTHVADFSGAINDETALLFAAHPSNYKIVGFSEEVKLSELVKLGKKFGIPVMEDLGSGILVNLAEYGLKDEPTVGQCIADGADIITFSGDKLLGGPQAGIIVGKKKYVDAMKKNQLTRALRVDKLTIAALEGTLLEYLSGNPYKNIPVLHMLTVSKDELYLRAKDLYDLLEDKFKKSGIGILKEIQVVDLEDMVGGGAYPIYKLPGFGVQLDFEHKYLEKITKKLRLSKPALLTRKQDEKMLVSVRTLLPGEEKMVVNLISQAIS